MFLGEQLKCVFSSQFFRISPNVGRNFAFFYINSRRLEKVQKLFYNFLINFPPTYGGLKILSGHFVMKFPSASEFFFPKKSIIYPLIYHKSFKKFRVVEHCEKE